MSMITSERVEQAIRVVEVAARKAAKDLFADLTRKGVLREDNFQRILSQGDKVTSAIMPVLTKVLSELAEKIVGPLKLISDVKTITLKPTTGEGMIGMAEETFLEYIDSDFKDWNLNVKGTPTKYMSVQIHALVKNGTFSQIYGGFGENLDRLCMTQDQIIDFCEKHSEWLSVNLWTFFLFKVDEEFFVARVGVYPAGLNVNVNRFSNDNVWNAENGNRFVIPKLTFFSPLLF